MLITREMFLKQHYEGIWMLHSTLEEENKQITEQKNESPNNWKKEKILISPPC